MLQTGHPKKSSAGSWLAVLLLAAAIFAVLWGISRVFGDINLADRLVYVVWSDPLYWVISGLGVLVILTVMGLTMVASGKGDGSAVRRQLLVLGPWVLYLPTCAGSVLAVLGIISVMVTPFLGGGLVAMAAVLLGDIGILPQDVGDWIARGIVTPRYDWISYEDAETRFLIARGFVAVGLAITLVGFGQILKAWREKRLETGGLYSSVRHPQYLGIALWTFGLAVAVNGVAAYLTWYTVVFLCVMVSVWEERRLVAEIPGYAAYRRKTPFMIPSFRAGLAVPGSRGGRIIAFMGYYVVGLAVVCVILWAIGVEHGGYL